MRSRLLRSALPLSAITLASLSMTVGCGSSADTDGSSNGFTSTGSSHGKTSSTGSSAGGAGGGGGGGGSQSGPASGNGGTGGGIIIGGTCASGIICGSGDCCDAGDECVSDKCQKACATKVRCGTDDATCCGAAELCLGGTCVAAKGPCLDYSDCDDNEFCEPTLGECVPEVPGAPVCEFKPPVGALSPKIEWSWTSSAIAPTYVQVINMPVVVDLDKDGTPDVIIVTSTDFTATHFAYLRALNGKDGVEKWPANTDVYKDAYRVQPRGTPAAGDLDGDGQLEIVAFKGGGGLIAFNHDGSYRWTSTQKDGTTPYTSGFDSGTVELADMDGDGKAEIIAGGVIFDYTGKLISDNGTHFGSHDTSYGASSIVADVDGDGQMELIGGNKAFSKLGTMQLWSNGEADGYPAIADLDGDGNPELVVVSSGTVRVQDAKTGVVLARASFPSGVGGAGGPPTIADFNGDGKPDFSTAGGNGYMVFTYTPANGATPAAINLLWQSVTQDLSSNRTGSSVFDFQGDGSAEVVYGDECYFRIYSGKDGTILFQDPSSSATIHEYPVVVDVDGDNQTEVIVVSNDSQKSTCAGYNGQNLYRHGVFVYGDADNKWVRTRRLWNQHAYHVTNVNADGSIPQHESPSWINPPGLNNYRQSSQGQGVYNAPDLQVSLSASLASCPDKVHLDALVQNHGSLGVAAGVDVSFYVGTSPNGTLITSTKTSGALLPGEYEVVGADYTVPSGAMNLSFYVVVDGLTSGGAVSECLEDNNTGNVSGVTCPSIN